MPLRIALDRALPIPIGIQLKGQIEYGIVSGVLRPGERLPSVREMAATEGVAHATVSHVYSALKRDGLISMRPGMGTYVADNGDGPRAGDGLGELHKLVDAMVVQALESGFTPAQISHMVTARLAGGRAWRPMIALVGLFSHATEIYAREVATRLADFSPQVAAHTIQGLRTGSEDERERARAADVILTLANRVKEVQELLGPCHPPVRVLTFVAHPDTVRQLQALPGDLVLGVVTTFAEFLPTMLQGISECVTLKHTPLCAVLSDAARVHGVLAQAGAIIFASGSEEVLAAVPRGKPVIEYLHTPEPSSVEAVRSLLEQLAVSWTRTNGEGG